MVELLPGMFVVIMKVFCPSSFEELHVGEVTVVRGEIVKKPAVLLYLHTTGDVRISQAMQLLGFRVEVCTCEKELLVGLRSSSGFDLLILDGRNLSALHSDTRKAISHWTAVGGVVTLTGTEGLGAVEFPFEVLDDPLEPLALHELSRRHLRNYSRNHPRIDTRLPGLYVVKDQFHFCEILNLGPGGAFVKTGGTLPATADLVEIHVPLLGMHKELELACRVVYQVLPAEHNNYLQGIGVSFDISADVGKLALLADYVSNSLCDPHHSSFAAVYYPYPQSGHTIERASRGGTELLT